MKTDIQIAQEAEMIHIREVAAQLSTKMSIWHPAIASKAV